MQHEGQGQIVNGLGTPRKDEIGTVFARGVEQTGGSTLKSAETFLDLMGGG